MPVDFEFDSFVFPWNNIKIVCSIATRWGAYHGGINVFNREMCLGIRRADSKLRIICIVEEMSNEDESDAEKNNIELIKANDFRSYESIRKQLVEKNIYPNAYLGHDIHTGNLALELAKTSINVASIVICHFDYESYAGYKGKLGYEIQNVINKQKYLFKHADIVFSVGPKLKEAIERLTRRESKTLYPACFEIGEDYICKKMFNGLYVMASGRLNKEDDNIKNISAATSAFVEYAKSISGNNILTLIGMDEDDIIKLGEQNQLDRTNIKGLSFTNDRNLIYDELSTKTMFIMPSVHEGFGLTGLEAISTEVPLIITENSGLFEMLKEVELDNLVTSVAITGSEEVNTKLLLDAIQQIDQNREKSKNNAIELRKQLNEKFSWETLGKSILNEIRKRHDNVYFSVKTTNDFEEFKNNHHTNTYDEIYFLMRNEIEKIINPNNGYLEKKYGEILQLIVSMSNTKSYLVNELNEDIDNYFYELHSEEFEYYNSKESFEEQITDCEYEIAKLSNELARIESSESLEIELAIDDESADDINDKIKEYEDTIDEYRDEIKQIDVKISEFEDRKKLGDKYIEEQQEQINNLYSIDKILQNLENLRELTSSNQEKVYINFCLFIAKKMEFNEPMI